MYNCLFILSIANIVFALLMFRDNRLAICSVYPLFVLGWLIYFFFFDNAPIDIWSYALGSLLGIGALAIFLNGRISDSAIWLGIQPVILIILSFIPFLTSITSVVIIITHMARGLT